MFDLMTFAARLLQWRDNITADELQAAAVLLALCLTVLVVFNKRG